MFSPIELAVLSSLVAGNLGAYGFIIKTFREF